MVSYGLDDLSDRSKSEDELDSDSYSDADLTFSSPLAHRRAPASNKAGVKQQSVTFAVKQTWPIAPSARSAHREHLVEEDSDDSSDSETSSVDEVRRRREFSVDDAYDSEEEAYPVEIAPRPSNRARLTALDVAASEDWQRTDDAERARAWSAITLSFSQQLQGLRARQAAAAEAHRQRRRAERDAEAAEIAALVEALDLERKTAAARESEAFEARNNELWTAINAAIAANEQLQAQRAAEAEAARKAQAAAERAEAEAEAERKRAAAERDAKAEKARQEAAAIEAERKRAEEASQAIADKAGEMGREWLKWTDKMRTLKSNVLPAVSNDATLRKACSAARRQMTPKVGQLVNTSDSVSHITEQLDRILVGMRNGSTVAYTWGLNHLSKALIRQAETEVTAKQSVAFPLARVIVGLILRGHAEFGDVLMARLVKKCFWIAAWYPRKTPGMSDEEHLKLLGHPSTPPKENPGDPDPPVETAVQYSERMAGILALYAAIIQTSPVASPQSVFGQPPDQATSLIPAHFQPNAGWRWFVRVMDPPLNALEPLPNLLETFLSVAGAGLTECFGKQFIKLLVCLHQQGIVERKAGFSDQTRASQVKLQLLIEDWIKAGRPLEAEGRALQTAD